MSDKITLLRKNFVIFSILILFGAGIAGCRVADETLPPVVETLEVDTSQPSQTEPQGNQSTPTDTPQVSTPDPAAIEAAWRSSEHANSFVLDANGQNNTCARCHAPINWMPALEDLPESCFACKFELEAPPPTISEADWTDIPCNICHKVDKKDNILPEFAWLEIAPLGEYAAVASATELCLKCHDTTGIPAHGVIQLSGAHAGYECTKCHSAHDTKTSCDPAGCHAEPTAPTAGHDADHQAVACVACHDGSGMEVEPNDDGIWTTFTSGTTETSTDKFSFTSHNVVLEASCDRCHFLNNPWGLSDSVTVPQLVND